MFAKAVYLGYYPLGGDLEISGIKVMQAEWMQLRKPAVFAFGKSYDGVSPAFCKAFYVKSEEKYALESDATSLPSAEMAVASPMTVVPSILVTCP
mgnify:CR=1 FL=1